MDTGLKYCALNFLVGANSSCLIFECQFPRHQFIVLSAATGKNLALIGPSNAIPLKVFVTKQLAVFYYSTKNGHVLNIYVTPLGKKIASYNLSDLSRDIAIAESFHIISIDFENNQLTIVYFISVERSFISRALVISMPEDAILAFVPQIPPSQVKPVTRANSFFSSIRKFWN